MAGENGYYADSAWSKSASSDLAAPLDNSSASSSGAGQTGAEVFLPPLISKEELNDVLNVTREYPFDYAKIMFGYMMPFVLIITVITNTMVVVVLAQRHMRTPTNIVLFTMAIVDLMTLLSPSPWFFYIYTLGYHDKFLYPPTACLAHHIMTNVIPVFFHTSSIWLALLLAGQRYVYVCHPTLARSWCTVPKVRKAIVIILVVAFLHQSTHFCDTRIVSVRVPVGEDVLMACKMENADWMEHINIAVYHITYFTFRIFFVFVIPCTALITLNYLLFRALRRAEAKRTELLRSKFKLVGGKYRHIHQTRPRHVFHRSAGPCENSAMLRENSSFISATVAPSPAGASALMHHSDVQMQQAAPKSNFALKAGPNFNRTTRGLGRAQMSATRRSISTVSENEAGALESRSVSVKNRAVRSMSGNSCEQQSERTRRREELRRRLSGPSGRRLADEDKNEEVGEEEDEDEGEGEEDEDEDEDEEGLMMRSTSKADESDDDLCSICPECTSCGRGDEFASGEICPRCSSLLVDVGSAPDKRDARDDPFEASEQENRRDSNCDKLASERNQFQTMSQCSSLIGVATHTTLNEDTSSLMAAQNASGSMQQQTNEDGDTTLDAVYADEEEEDDDDDDGEGPADDDSLASGDSDRNNANDRSGRTPRDQLMHRANRLPVRTNRERNAGTFVNSASVDSRLTCGCLSASKVQTKHRHLARDDRRLECVACSRLISRDHSAQNYSSQESQSERANHKEPISLNSSSSPSSSASSSKGSGHSVSSLSEQRRGSRREQDEADEEKGTTASRASSDPCLSCGGNFDKGHLARAKHHQNESNHHQLHRASYKIARLNGAKLFKSDLISGCVVPSSQSKRHSDKASSVEDNRRCSGPGPGAPATKVTESPKPVHQDQACPSMRGACSNLDHEAHLDKSQELVRFPRGMSATRTATTANTTTTTTTTTTLYSAHTNSAGSLLQVAQQVAQRPAGAGPAEAGRQQARPQPAEPYVSAGLRMKSPSFASSIGRGSRATLLGIPGIACGGAGASGLGAGLNRLPMIVTDGSVLGVASTSTPASIRTMDSNRTTLMLIVVVTVFLMVEVPVAIVTILHVLLNIFRDSFKEIQMQTLDYIKLFTNFFIVISYSVNFSIYCSMSKKFRETFRELFMCSKQRKCRRAVRQRYSRDANKLAHRTAPHYSQPSHCHSASQHIIKRQFDERFSKSTDYVEPHRTAQTLAVYQAREAGCHAISESIAANENNRQQANNQLPNDLHDDNAGLQECKF